jgi:hypothetical protein
MSTRTSRKAAVLETDEERKDVHEFLTVAQPAPAELELTDRKPVPVEEGALPDSDIATAEMQVEQPNTTGELSGNAIESGDSADALAQQLEQLVRTISVVEELSRRAREAATTDLALYEALHASQQQYVDRLAQATALRDQACGVHDRAFGMEARSAAEPLVANAERVVRAFAELSGAWEERASAFLQEHPDVELLLAEQRLQEEQARQAEALQARERRLRSLVAAFDEANRTGATYEGRRLLEVIGREFPEQTAAIEAIRLRVAHGERAAKDDAARQALAASAGHQARGDLEAAVNALEQVDVHGLSQDVSEDVFGRWSDACSRLALASGTPLKRYAPSKGRGVILYADPEYPNGLIVFSSLGMGTDFKQRDIVTNSAILNRARTFRDAKPLPIISYGVSTGAISSTPLPIRH